MFDQNKNVIHFNYICNGNNDKGDYTKNLFHFLFRESCLKKITYKFLISNINSIFSSESEKNNIFLVQVDVWLFSQLVHRFRIPWKQVEHGNLVHIKSSQLFQMITLVKENWESLIFSMNSALEYEKLNLTELRAQSEILELAHKVHGINKEQGFVADVVITFHSEEFPVEGWSY